MNFHRNIVIVLISQNLGAIPIGRGGAIAIHAPMEAMALQATSICV